MAAILSRGKWVKWFLVFYEEGIQLHLLSVEKLKNWNKDFHIAQNQFSATIVKQLFILQLQNFGLLQFISFKKATFG